MKKILIVILLVLLVLLLGGILFIKYVVGVSPVGLVKVLITGEGKPCQTDKQDSCRAGLKCKWDGPSPSYFIDGHQVISDNFSGGTCVKAN